MIYSTEFDITCLGDNAKGGIIVNKGCGRNRRPGGPIKGKRRDKNRGHSGGGRVGRGKHGKRIIRFVSTRKRTSNGAAYALIRKGQKHRLSGWSFEEIRAVQAILKARDEVWARFAGIPVTPASQYDYDGYYAGR